MRTRGIPVFSVRREERNARLERKWKSFLSSMKNVGKSAWSRRGARSQGRD